MLFLIAILMILFSVLAWHNLRLAILGVVALLPTYLLRFSIGPIPFTVLEGILLITVAVGIFRAVQQKKWTWTPYVWIALGVMVAATVATFVSPNSRAAWGQWKAYFLEPILFFFVVANTFKTKDSWYQIVDALGVASVVVSLVAWVQYFTHWFLPAAYITAEGVRATSVYGYPNAIGLFVAPIVILFIGRLMQRIVQPKPRKDWQQLVWFATVMVSGLGALVFAQSEGALVGVAVGLVMLGLLLKPWRVFTLSSMAVVMAIVLAVAPLREFAIEKGTFSDTSGRLRLIMWQETVQLIGDHPVVGAGLAGYATAIEPYHHAFRLYEIYLYPHQLVLNVWVELGVLGMAAFGSLVAWFFFLYTKAG